MGWRVLKCGYLNTDEELRWVSLMYDAYTKSMKVEVKVHSSENIPQLSLIIKPNSVSLLFDSKDPKFIVDLKNKLVGNITLSISDEMSHNFQDRIAWQTLFKTAVNPSVMYSVTIVKTQSQGDKEAILYVNENDIQLSAVQYKPGDKYDNIISTDIEKVSMTIEDVIILSMNKQNVMLRTPRLIELYQHLLSVTTGKSSSTDSFSVARVDYENIRRGSRDKLTDEINDSIYVHPSLLTMSTASRSSSAQSSPRNSPHTSPSLAATGHLPKLNSSPPKHPPTPPPLGTHPKVTGTQGSPTKVTSDSFRPTSMSVATKPTPPPKPANSKDILYEYNKSEIDQDEPITNEPVYKTVQKDYKKSSSTVSSGSIYAAMEEFVNDDQPPALPPTPTQYMDMSEIANRNSYYQNYSADPLYQNMPRMPEPGNTSAEDLVEGVDVIYDPPDIADDEDGIYDEAGMYDEDYNDADIYERYEDIQSLRETSPPPSRPLHSHPQIIPRPKSYPGQSGPSDDSTVPKKSDKFLNKINKFDISFGSLLQNGRDMRTKTADTVTDIETEWRNLKRKGKRTSIFYDKS